MSKNRIKLVISDCHLGAGPTTRGGETNYLEDFFLDKKLVEFLEFHMSGEYAKAEVELVINGDFFNHLQVFPDEDRPELMTERVVFMRTEAIVAGHAEVFEALVQFAAAPRHSVVFMIGNHDIGLLWPSVRDYVTSKLGPTVRVHSAPVYADNGVWIEHGNQRVAENRIDFERPFIGNGKGDPIINIPWGNLFVVCYLNRMKKERPYIDKVYPFKLYLRWSLIHDTGFAFRAAAMGAAYFVAVLLRLGENRRFARQQFWKIMKEFSFPVKMDRAAKRIFAQNPGCRIVVFGHGHQAASKLFEGGRRYFNTGIWNEMISLELGSMGRHQRLTFVEIGFDREGIPQGSLREWKGAYRQVEELGLV